MRIPDVARHRGSIRSRIFLVCLTILTTVSVSPAVQSTHGKKPNRLIHEKSPYLLQHAHNPVDWYPWGEAAFVKARKEHKLIFLSIGYSTCYWCHVMERQVFEDGAIAALMNQFFVNIKVDREERPDLDRVYMAALQAISGGGGWPMSMFLTPDLKPFFGASYIPPVSFRKLIEQIHETWLTEPDKILTSSGQLVDLLKQHASIDSTNAKLEKSLLTRAFQQIHGGYDPQNGGFGGRPKFARPVVFSFLLRYYHRFGENRALEMTLKTLRKMAEGGIHDHLGGGFHRYSVDAQWRVPHFEKMLYDQAQLAIAYLEAYQITRDELFAHTARKTLNYVLRRLTHVEGGFYSAEDAESAPDPSKPEQKEEGAFYVWTKEEIERVLGNQRAAVFAYAFGVQAEGNSLEDPHHVFAGKNILYVAHSLEDTAKKFNKTVEEISKLLSESRDRLLAERDRRPRPHLDDKILVSWNGLMISAFARAYSVLGDETYLHTAERSANFILSKLYDPNARLLLRRYRSGESRFEGHLEDYAAFTLGLLDLYEADLDFRWLKQVLELTERQNALFYDQQQGGFYDTSGRDESVLFRTKEDYDGAEPTGNSLTTWNLLRLSQMTDNTRLRTMAERTLSLFAGRLQRSPDAMPLMLAALDFHIDKPKQIIIAGDPKQEAVRYMLKEVHKRYIPNKIILFADGGPGQRFLGQSLPFIKSMRMIDGRATAYVCENYVCKLPTSDLQVMAKLLGGK